MLKYRTWLWNNVDPNMTIYSDADIDYAAEALTRSMHNAAQIPVARSTQSSTGISDPMK